MTNGVANGDSDEFLAQRKYKNLIVLEVDKTSTSKNQP